MKIDHFDLDFTRLPFVAPFGFKGSYLNEMWQTNLRLIGADHLAATGVGAQSVLWSDPGVFLQHSEAIGNVLMLLTTDAAARQAVGREWDSPLALQEAILDAVHRQAGELTGRGDDLRLTFTLNAMVALDNAAWLLLAKSRGITDFETLIPDPLRTAFAPRQQQVALIPLISYGVAPAAVEQLLDDGCCLLKIKIGSDPAQDGDRQAMLEWDKQRLAEIHALAKDRGTPHTESGQVLYYLDANGRYDSLERMGELLEFAGAIGALDRIIVLEEPFPEEHKLDVSELPVRVAADESAHSVADVEERIGLGYGAIALKPIAKTLSMTLRMLQAARVQAVPCFCADLTVTPRLVEWNKNVAARLDPLPGMKISAMETNGAQNYRDWPALVAQLPFATAPWLAAHQGVFELGEEFYARSGGIFEPLTGC